MASEDIEKIKEAEYKARQEINRAEEKAEEIIEKIQNELGLNLNDIEKINIKDKFLIRTKTGEIKEIPLKEAKKFVRPSCKNCSDFSAELADISCGGVGLKGWTYTVNRTDIGADAFDNAVEEDLLEVEPTENFQTSTKTLIKLSKIK